MEKILKNKYIEIPIQKAIKHIGHDITVATYGTEDQIVNVSIECEECNEVLGDLDV